jgi:hypothetical protein
VLSSPEDGESLERDGEEEIKAGASRERESKKKTPLVYTVTSFSYSIILFIFSCSSGILLLSCLTFDSAVHRKVFHCHACSLLLLLFILNRSERLP